MHKSSPIVPRLLALAIVVLCATSTSRAADAVAEARGVISRAFGSAALAGVTLATLPPSPTDVFEYTAQDGRLTVRGSSPVAIASGFYQFVRRHELGIASWTGNRLDRSKPWPDTPTTRVETPYALRYYFNVVTFGYTMPYWTWDRWQQEIDWMALHGVNMPLSVVGTEAIASRVWRQIGLTQAEIDEYYTGPAHLPWQRMGNVANVDGPLTDSWHIDQIALQHRILDRERALGMKPIAQGFSGFVPRGVQRVFPAIKLTEMNWSGFKKDVEHAHLLAPDASCFNDIGRRIVQEWEKEFGKCEYFLADSFNEVKLPTDDRAEQAALLQRYGDAVYRSIAAGDPDATWVMQGWIFVYDDHKIWTKENLKALLSKVPDDKMLILDEAIDYSPQRGGGKPTFTKYDGYFGKRWIAGYIPNMGGQSLFIGPLDFYGRGFADLTAALDHGRLSGIGIVPEGIENNEVVYELIADTTWTGKPIDVSQWLKTYARSRYGPATPASADEAWRLLHTGPYTKRPGWVHDRWQVSPGKKGPTFDHPNLVPAAAALLAAAPQLKDNALYRADLIELAAMAAGGYADRLIARTIEIAEPAARRKAADRVIDVLTRMDRLLSQHPTLRLDRWVAFARAHGSTPAEKDRYEANAKLLVSLWGHNGEINDYSARMWSGLIGGYYVPRWRMYFDSLDGKPQKIRDWEKQWAATPEKPFTPSKADAVVAAEELLALTAQPLPDTARIEIGPAR